jgi:signal peptidase I
MHTRGPLATVETVIGAFDRVKGRLPQPWKTIADWGLTILVAAVLVLAFEAEVAKPFRIPSPSMEPTLHCAAPGSGCLGSSDDRVLVNRLAYRFDAPERGQVVVFTAPPAAARCGPGDGGTTFVKRLIGLPGDLVTERRGVVFVDGRRLDEPYLDPALRDRGSGSWRVPPGHYFFLGDNRVDSCDSRTWGSVPRSSLIGPVLLTYWPPTRIGWR